MHPEEARINEYVDGTLGADERAELERHFAECASCRTLADDLRELTLAARNLAPTEPPATAWRRLETALRTEPGKRETDSARLSRARGFRYAAYGLAAAAVLIVATAVGLRVSPGRRQPTAAPATTSTTAVAAPGDAAQSVEAELRAAEAHYDNAIKGLEQIANANQGSLDPATAATLQKNLAVIDQAITESRAAVQAQPNSEPAQQSLLENFRTKVAVLQDTVALINEMRKGNEAGAARIVSGLKQKSE
jgi:anti-sigma factor RsiW